MMEHRVGARTGSVEYFSAGNGCVRGWEKVAGLLGFWVGLEHKKERR
jgi:hypothetical protein